MLYSAVSVVLYRCRAEKWREVESMKLPVTGMEREEKMVKSNTFSVFILFRPNKAYTSAIKKDL